MLDNKTIFISGGTGSFGNQFVQTILKKYKPKQIIIYSRDEYKQFVMKKKFSDYNNVLKFVIGDVRDKYRLIHACSDADFIIHAAALKQVPICEYNPIEAVKTNIIGAENIIEAALANKIERIVALSTDKAVSPVNLYGATKLASDKLFIAANSYMNGITPKFSVVRYGNVAGSRGSVIPLFRDLLQKGNTHLPITDLRMTRFWITLQQACDMVLFALSNSKGGETFISKIPSFKVETLARAFDERIELREIGIREGEKLHESMISPSDSSYTYEYKDHYIIYPNFNWWNKEERFMEGGKKVSPRFEYSSDINTDWLNRENLVDILKKMDMY